MSNKKSMAFNQIERNKVLSTGFETEAINTAYRDNMNILIVCSVTGSNAGTFTIEGRIKSDNTIDSDWIDLGVSPAMTLADASQTFNIILNQICFTDVRVKFTAGVGTDGTCNIFFKGQDL